jgi:hypothetical protein
VKWIGEQSTLLVQQGKVNPPGIQPDCVHLTQRLIYRI